MHLNFLLGSLVVILIQSAWGQSNSSGVKADTNWKAGDKYEYRSMDLYSRVAKKARPQIIVKVEDGKVFYASGDITDLYGNEFQYARGDQLANEKISPEEYFVGKEWRTVYTVARHSQVPNVYEFSMHFVVEKIETITVPAGTFTAFKVEGTGNRRLISGNGPDDGRPVPMQATLTYWIAPEKLRRYVARERVLRGSGSTRVTHVAFREELTSYFQQIDVGKTSEGSPDKSTLSDDNQKAR